MKRYLVFIGDCYYPDGGMDDFEGDFDTLEEAKDFITEKANKENFSWKITWAHIWDTETKSQVWGRAR